MRYSSYLPENYIHDFVLEFVVVTILSLGGFALAPDFKSKRIVLGLIIFYGIVSLLTVFSTKKQKLTLQANEKILISFENWTTQTLPYGGGGFVKKIPVVITNLRVIWGEYGQNLWLKKGARLVLQHDDLVINRITADSSPEVVELWHSNDLMKNPFNLYVRDPENFIKKYFS